MRLSVNQKYRVCQIVCGLALVTVLFSLRHMSPFASSHMNKVWFARLIGVVAIALPFAIGITYYRARLRDVDTEMVNKVAVETLSNVHLNPSDEPNKKS